MIASLSKDVAKGLSRRAAVCLLTLAAAMSFELSSRAVAADLPLAIKGYDPVAYFVIGKPTAGLPAFEHQWDGHRYRFARAEHRDLFAADPARYAPQFDGFCAMALSLGRLVESNPEQWLVTDGKLYVFGSPAPKGPALFQQDLAANIVKANQNRTLIPKR